MNPAWRGPSAGGRPWVSNEFDLKGLGPAVGLRRPGKHLLCRRRPTPGASAPGEADFQSAQKPSAGGRPWVSNEFDLKGLGPTVGLRRPIPLRRRRPTPGAERLGRLISISAKAFGRGSACADRESIFCVGGGRRLARKRLGRPISIGAKGPTPGAGQPWVCGMSRGSVRRGLARRPKEISVSILRIGSEQGLRVKEANPCRSGFRRDLVGSKKIGIAG